MARMDTMGDSTDSRTASTNEAAPATARRRVIAPSAGVLSMLAAAAALGVPVAASSNHEPVGADYANRVPVQKMPPHQGRRERTRRQRRLAKAEGK